MPGFIRAIVAATLIQILVVVGLVVYMSNHDTDIAKEYALLAESTLACTPILATSNSITDCNKNETLIGWTCKSGLRKKSPSNF